MFLWFNPYCVKQKTRLRKELYIFEIFDVDIETYVILSDHCRAIYPNASHGARNSAYNR